jgi:ferredoxin
MNREIIDIAKKSLSEKQVELVLGFQENELTGKIIPLFCSEPDDCEKLLTDLEKWRNYHFNLATYLIKKEVVGEKKLLFIGFESLIRSLGVLKQEKQLDEERLLVCNLDNLSAGIVSLQTAIDWIKENPDTIQGTKTDLSAINAMGHAERFTFFQEHFSRCTRCYACRSACPLCYCPVCIVEKNQPQWIPSSAHETGNFSWNITRAFHLAGRCTNCGACEAACPVGIPLNILNTRVSQSAEKHFGYKSGLETEKPGAHLSFKPDDKEDFFL